MYNKVRQVNVIIINTGHCLCYPCYLLCYILCSLNFLQC